MQSQVILQLKLRYGSLLVPLIVRCKYEQQFWKQETCELNVSPNMLLFIDAARF